MLKEPFLAQETWCRLDEEREKKFGKLEPTGPGPSLSLR
jgi:hypothetical protein